MTLLQLWLIARRVGLPLSRETEAHLIMKYGSREQRVNLALYLADQCADQLDLWCGHVSSYLSYYDLAPISIRPSGSNIIEQLYVETAKPLHIDRKVSVLIAAYNSSETIGWAVKSILNQTWRNLEVFIVDDASTDDTWSLASSIAQQDPRVSVIRNAVNVGPFVSRNRVLPFEWRSKLASTIDRATGKQR